MSLNRRGERIHVLAAVIVTAALGLACATQALAAPVSGQAVGQAAAAASPMTKVACAMRRVCDARGCVSRRVCN
jgi:hypothetical protein